MLTGTNKDNESFNTVIYFDRPIIETVIVFTKMKKLILIIVLIVFICAATDQIAPDHRSCQVYMERFRKLILKSTPELKLLILENLRSLMLNVFPKTDKTTIHEFIKMLKNSNITVNQCCKVLLQEFITDWKKQEPCIRKCIKLNIPSMEQFLKIFMKCQKEIECYKNEFKISVEKLTPCVNKCMFTIVSMKIEETEFNNVHKFWTRENMRQAIPLNVQIDDIKAKWMKLGSKTEYVPDNELPFKPYPQIGKVYFVMHGRKYSCSAFAVGKSVVMTAGHCTSDGNGNWHRYEIFRNL